MANSVTSRTGSRLTSRRSSLYSARSLSHSKRNSRPTPAAPSDRKDALLGTLANPAHVLNRDTPRGWAVIQRAVDEFDKDQIEGVKNDIDTLLVFIGLFSAVLSAFLVVAVALLQEDIPGATLTTLRQMSAQNANYTIQGDFIISTSPVSTSSPPFEPSVNAIRINDLWAASLVISLATASFGILVKQWLREYMKFVTSFPQGRLRIRNFRRAGLETWKVLTIAACLPLLLQLALGLFFIGLCFYTAELHSSVRNTTLPLVAGWGFIFFFVTVSPLFSDHCPYKTPALNSLMVAIRAYARARWISCMEALQRRAYGVWRWTPSRFSTVKKIAYMIDDWARRYVRRLQKPARPHSEAAAAKHEAGDLDIMVAADALQGNDEIVGTAMVDALQQITPKPEDIITFVLQILQHRVPWQGKFEDPPQIIDCSMATTRALDSIYSILQRHLPIDIVIRLEHESNDGLRWVARWTVALHFSAHLSHLDFDGIPSYLHRHVAAQPELFAEVYASKPSAAVLRDILGLACQYCRESQLDLIQSITRIKFVVEPFFIKLRLTDSFESNFGNAPWRKVLNEDTLHNTVGFLIDLLRDDTAAQDDEWSNAQHNTLALIIKLIAVDPGGLRDSIADVRRMTLSSKSDAVVVKLLTLLIKFYPLSFYWYVNHEDFRTDTAALSRVATAIETIATNPPDQLTRLSVLQACKSLAESVYRVREDVKGTALTESWRGIFAALTSLVQAAAVLEDGVALRLLLSFSWLSRVDARNEDDDPDDNEKYLAWRAAFKPEESPIPDGFYLTLMDISIPGMRYWRVRRLQEMTPEEREEAAKDIEPYLRKRTAHNLDNSAAGPSTERGEGSGGGAGAVDGSGQADVPGEVKEREGSSDDTDRVDAPREAEEHDDFGNNPEVDAEELELDTNVAPAPESDGHRLAADGEHSAEPGEAILEDTVEPNLEAAGLSHTKSPEDALPEAAELCDTKSPNDASPEAETVADDPADEGISDDRSPKTVLSDPGDNSDVIKVQDGEQGLGSSGDGGEQAGTDVGHDEGILDDGLHESEDEHVMTFR